MAWIILLFAGLCEIAWAVGLKNSQGFSRLWPSVWTAAMMIASFVLLGMAIRSLPLGTAYAVWTGIGAVGTGIYGMWRFGESPDVPRLICLGLIVAGILGLRLVTRTP